MSFIQYLFIKMKEQHIFMRPNTKAVTMLNNLESRLVHTYEMFKANSSEIISNMCIRIRFTNF